MRSITLLSWGLLLIAGSVLAAPLFIQGEHFDCDGETWKIADQGSRYAPDSGLKHLAGAEGGQGTATAEVDIPAAGEYVVWVRHSIMSGPEGSANRGAFRVSLSQAAEQVAAANLDVAAPESPPGQVHGYIWSRFPASVEAGRLSIELSKLPPLNCSTWTRYVDCLVLADDPEYTPDVSEFQPKTWLRVTLADTPGPPIYIHCFCDHFRAPWYKHFSLSRDGYEERVAPRRGKAAFLEPGESTGWCDITPAIHEDTGARLELRGAEKYSYTEWLPALDATFEFATGPDEKAVVKTFRKTGPGAGLSIITPGVLAEESADRLKADYEYCAESRELADRLPVIDWGARPREFPFFIGMGLRKGLYSPNLRRDEFSVAARLGFNGSHDDPDDVLTPLGFTHACGSTGSWYRKEGCYQQPEVNRIREKIGASAPADENGAPDFVMLMDEPSADSQAHVCSCATCGEGFRAWLRDDLKLTPAALGADDWTFVRPVSQDEKDSLPALYYYTQRFRAKSFGDFLRLQTDEVTRQWPGSPPSTVNFSDGTVYNAGMYEAGVDYFHLFSTQALSMAWSEDWSNIASTYQCCGYNVEILRAATKYHKQPIGMYVITSYGRSPLDVKLKAYSSIARDARALWSFAYGPHYAGHEPNWYLREEMYGPIRELAYEIGGAEDLLMDARRGPSEVAMLYSTSSDIWNAFETTLYGHERMHSYLALTHARVPVDFLSEDDVAEGELAGRKVLYVFGPNLRAAAAGPITEWVRSGGTLYLAAGSAVCDEFNKPSRPLDDALGFSRGPVSVIEKQMWPGRYLQGLRPAGTVSVNEGTADVLAVSQTLPGQAGAEIVARFSDETPAAVTIPAGDGHVYLTGFNPGLSYIRKALLARDAEGTPVPDLEDPVEFNTQGSFSNLRPQDVSYNPWEYPESEREFILAPVRAAGVMQPVQVDHEVVEAFVLEGPRGDVVTLANYSLRPIETLAVSVRTRTAVQRVESVRRGSISFTRDGDRIRFSLPLADTDMVKLYR